MKDYLQKNKIFSVTFCFMLMFPAVSLAAPIGGFEDNEASNGNSVFASNLDLAVSSFQTQLEPNATAISMVPGTTVSRDANVSNIGDENFKYKVEFEKVSGADELCGAVQLTAQKNAVTVYSGSLNSLSFDAGTLNSGNDDDWDFSIAMPIGTTHNVEGESCNFNFKFVAWQTIFVGPTQGWVVADGISGNQIIGGDWEPVILGVGNTDPLDTKGVTNDDMSKISVSWSTDENTTSDVIYDTVSHLACSGYVMASFPADLTYDSTDHEVILTNLLAGTTYYYRALSQDVGGHSVCSDEYSFSIPSSTVDAPSSSIVLNEFVPNPAGVESGEWVELYNTSGLDVGVNGWYVYDSTNSNGVQITNANTSGGTTVPAHGWLVVYLNKTYLNNSGGDTVKLYSGVFGVGALIDSHAYAGAVPDGKSFARFPDGVGVWIDPDVTPGEKNELKPEEREAFLSQAAVKCFSGKVIVASSEDICQVAFLEYLGMIKTKKGKEMTPEMWLKFKPVETVPIVEVKTENIIEQPVIAPSNSVVIVENPIVADDKPVDESREEVVTEKNTLVDENISKNDDSDSEALAKAEAERLAQEKLVAEKKAEAEALVKAEAEKLAQEQAVAEVLAKAEAEKLAKAKSMEAEEKAKVEAEAQAKLLEESKLETVSKE